jgi:SAM-dependent methyltransferase
MRRHAPATDRNREPIAAVLAEELPEAGRILEVASGTGQHCAFFAQRFPRLVWQPTDPDLESLVSIADWCADIANVLPPVGLDASADDWPVGRVDAMLCINMVHISPWAATLGLMAGAGQLLDPGAPLILYGPYRQHGVPTAASNEEFDLSLRARNPDWGLRHVEDVARVAAEQRLTLKRIEPMPANNLLLVFRRDA